MLFPTGYVATVFINSIGGLPSDEKGYPNLYKVLKQAYDNTIVNTAERQA
jgi:hypothetical protein